MGLPESSRIVESWETARLSSRSGSLTAARSETPPEALRLADVGVDDEGDEAVGVGVFFEEVAVEPELEGVGGPGFDDRVLCGRRPRRRLRGERAEGRLRFGPGEGVARGDFPEARVVAGAGPDEEALHVGSAYAHAFFGGVPPDLVGGVAEHRAVDLVVEVQVLEAVGFVDVADGALGAAGALDRFGRVVLRVGDEASAGHCVGRGLFDDGAGVVQGQSPVATAAALGPLLSVVEVEVLAIAAHAFCVEACELLRQRLCFDGECCSHPIPLPY